MSFKLFLIPMLVASVLYGFVMATVASADTVTVTVSTWESTCALVDGSVECDVHADQGISRVQVSLASGIGPISVFDQEYKDCLTDVHISLDPIVIDEASEMKVWTCGPSGIQVCKAEECPQPVDVVCIIDVTCEGEEPGVGVGRPDPLPLKSPAPEAKRPLVLAGAK